MSRPKLDVPREPNGRARRATGNPPGGSKPHGPVALRAVLACKVTTAEHEAVKAAAEAAGTSESAWMRRAVQEALTRAAVAHSVDAAIEEAAELRRELGRDHARQIAAHLDVVGGMPSATD